MWRSDKRMDLAHLQHLHWQHGEVWTLESPKKHHSQLDERSLLIQEELWTWGLGWVRWLKSFWPSRLGWNLFWMIPASSTDDFNTNGKCPTLPHISAKGGRTFMDHAKPRGSLYISTVIARILRAMTVPWRSVLPQRLKSLQVANASTKATHPCFLQWWKQSPEAWPLKKPITYLLNSFDLCWSEHDSWPRLEFSSKAEITEIASNSLFAWFVSVPSVYVDCLILFRLFMLAGFSRAGKGLIHYVVQPCSRLFEIILAWWCKFKKPEPSQEHCLIYDVASKRAETAPCCHATIGDCQFMIFLMEVAWIEQAAETAEKQSKNISKSISENI